MQQPSSNSPSPYGGGGVAGLYAQPQQLPQGQPPTWQQQTIGSTIPGGAPARGGGMVYGDAGNPQVAAGPGGVGGVYGGGESGGGTTMYGNQQQYQPQPQPQQQLSNMMMNASLYSSNEGLLAQVQYPPAVLGGAAGNAGGGGGIPPTEGMMLYGGYNPAAPQGAPPPPPMPYGGGGGGMMPMSMPMPAAAPPSAPPPPAMNMTDDNGLRWTWSTYPSAAALLAAAHPDPASPTNNNAIPGGTAGGASAVGSGAKELLHSATGMLSRVGGRTSRRKNPFFPTVPDMVIPLSCMFEPLKPLADPEATVPGYGPMPPGLQCTQCGAYCSMHSIREEGRSWMCLCCLRKYPMPPGLSPDHPLFRFSTVEFALSPAPRPPMAGGGTQSQNNMQHHHSIASSPPGTQNNTPGPSPPYGAGGAAPVPVMGVAMNHHGAVAGPPSSVKDPYALIFIVDICIPVEELRALQTSLLETVDYIPGSTLIGLITTGSTTSVWELGNRAFRHSYALRGDKALNYNGFSKALQVKGTQSSRGRFLVPLQECRERLQELLRDLHPDREAVPSTKRPTRTTGTAVAAATFLLEAISPLQRPAPGTNNNNNNNSNNNNDLGEDITTPTVAPLPSASIAAERVPGRVLLFTGGPCTRGGGAVASMEKEQLMRFHRDLIEGDTPFSESASKFYQALAGRLSYTNACLDVFAQSYDQVGVMEMRSCVDSTGGYMICGDAFEHENFANSMRRYLLRVGICHPAVMLEHLKRMYRLDDNNGEAAADSEAQQLDEEERVELEEWVYANAGVSGVGVEVEVLTATGDLMVSGVLGPCVAAAASVNAGAPNSGKKSVPLPSTVGVGNGSNRWFASSMQMDTALTMVFDVSPSAASSASSSPAYSPQPSGTQERFLQFVTRYTSLEGERRLRVTSVRLPIAPYAVSPLYFAQGGAFDQTCAAAVIARIAAHAMEKHPSQFHQIRRALDDVLITFVSRFATYRMGDPESVRLDPSVSLFPIFLFNLRRSEYFIVLNISPDESTFKRHWLLREPVDRCVLMLQPALYSYDIENPTATAVALDSQSLRADNIVLMDAFFNMHIMWGATIYEWIKAKFHENPEYEYFKSLLSCAEDDARALLSQRFPCPRFSRTDANGSEARHVKTRVNPAHTYSSSGSGIGGGMDPYGMGMPGQAGAIESADVINTDDTSIAKFMAALKKLVTTEDGNSGGGGVVDGAAAAASGGVKGTLAETKSAVASLLKR